MTELAVTERMPTGSSDDSRRPEGRGAKRSYQKPQLSELGPIVQATLGPTPDFGESSPAGNNFRIQ